MEYISCSIKIIKCKTEALRIIIRLLTDMILIFQSHIRSTWVTFLFQRCQNIRFYLYRSRLRSVFARMRPVSARPPRTAGSLPPGCHRRSPWTSGSCCRRWPDADRRAMNERAFGLVYRRNSPVMRMRATHRCARKSTDSIRAALV